MMLLQIYTFLLKNNISFWVISLYTWHMDNKFTGFVSSSVDVQVILYLAVLCVYYVIDFKA